MCWCLLRNYSLTHSPVLRCGASCMSCVMCWCSWRRCLRRRSTQWWRCLASAVVRSTCLYLRYWSAMANSSARCLSMPSTTATRTGAACLLLPHLLLYSALVVTYMWNLQKCWCFIIYVTASETKLKRSFSYLKSFAGTFRQGSHAPGKFWIFGGTISRSWKVLENGFGLGKSWKFECKVLESPGIF